MIVNGFDTDSLCGGFHNTKVCIGHFPTAIFEQMLHALVKVETRSLMSNEVAVHIGGAVHEPHAIAGGKDYNRIERQVVCVIIGHALRLTTAKGRFVGGQHGVDSLSVLRLVRPEVADGLQLIPQAVEVVALIQPNIQPPAAAEYQRIVRMPTVNSFCSSNSSGRAISASVMTRLLFCSQNLSDFSWIIPDERYSAHRQRPTFIVGWMKRTRRLTFSASKVMQGAVDERYAVIVYLSKECVGLRRHRLR